MENKTQYQAELFANRLRKKYKNLRKWARKNRISCFRLYDRDIPELPLSLDVYEFLPSDISTTIECARFLGEQNARLSANDHSVEEDLKTRTYAVLYLYERPYEKDEAEEELWLDAMAEQAASVIGIDKNHIVKKQRKHQKGTSQYEKNSSDVSNSPLIQEFELTQECGQLFRIDLATYLDTGLFFDHRPLRSSIRETCGGKSVLNLFCYTGSFSVYAAQGNASYVESVDLSNTYLNWAKENMALNGFTDKNRYVFTKQDCVLFLQQKAVAAKASLSQGTVTKPKSNSSKDLYDIIILDPPTFSNSKNTQNVMDINRDWPQLVKDCLNILAPGGTLYFSTNSERLKFELSKIPPKTAAGSSFTCTDITAETTPQDFEGKKPHRCWKLKLD